MSSVINISLYLKEKRALRLDVWAERGSNCLLSSGNLSFGSKDTKNVRC